MTRRNAPGPPMTRSGPETDLAGARPAVFARDGRSAKARSIQRPAAVRGAGMAGPPMR